MVKLFLKSFLLKSFFVFLTSVLVFGFPLSSRSHVVITNPELNVDVNTDSGPNFDRNDPKTVEDCLYGVFSTKFPFDFLPPDFEREDPGAGDGESGCPEIELFDNNYKMCYLVDIYDKIRPAVSLGLFIYAIINL